MNAACSARCRGLDLLRLQAHHGFSIVALGDDKQCTAVQAGATIDLARRALGAEQCPRDPDDAPPADRARATDRRAVPRRPRGRGTGHEARRSARRRWFRRLRWRRLPGGQGSTPRGCNDRGRTDDRRADQHRCTSHQRGGPCERRGMGLIGPDITSLRATDGERNYTLPIAGAAGSACSARRAQICKRAVATIRRQRIGAGNRRRRQPRASPSHEGRASSAPSMA